LLALRLNPADMATPWRWDGTRYVAGRSHLTPIHHPSVEHHLEETGPRTTITVRERRRHPPAGDLTAWDRPAVAVACTPDGHVSISTSACPVVPLYATVDRAGVLHASWDLTDLAGRTPSGRLHEVEVARLLALWLRYTPSTILADVVRLTERSTALLRDGTIQLALPADADHYAPRQLRPGADPIGAYENLLAAAISRRVYDVDTAVVEVSGGADSAQVALSLTSRHPLALTAAGMLMPDAVGAQQRARRAALIDGRFARDIALPALPPLHPSGARATGATCSPYEDPYTEATTAVLEAAAGGRAATVWTGTGGDEMLALSAAERAQQPIGHDRAPHAWLSARTVEALAAADTGLPPVTVVNEMTLLAFGYRAPAMLRAGCWPIHVLADPELIRFGEWLPRQWRSGKRLARARLERAGFAPEVVQPTMSENFRDVMRGAILGQAVPWLRLMLAQGGILLDDGYLDPDGLAATLDRIEAGGYREADGDLFEILAVEQAAQAFS
jgi:asparagine synthase (glutamine-hydrolysing)